MERFQKFIILLILVFFVSFSGYSQVTIGSSEEPLEGALLDLKERGDGVSARGLLLPRVRLQAIGSLAMVGDDGRELDVVSHEGLVVYNLTDDRTAFCPGVYFWSGSSWLRMGEDCSFFYAESLSKPNCYKVSPNSEFVFPVVKAYAAWKSLEALGNLDLKGAVTAELVWQDEKGLVSNLQLSGLGCECS